MTRAAARACDRLLDAVVLAFAAWTAIYHACLVARIGSGWALGAWVVVLALGAAGAAAVRLRSRRGVAAAPVGAAGTAAAAPVRRRWRVLLVAEVVLGLLAAVTFVVVDGPYELVWGAWLAASACALALTVRRARAAPTPALVTRGWFEPALVGIWSVGLAALSLFLLDPDGDDAFYVHMSSWIAAHGSFPVRDVVFSDQVFSALYYPPVFSYEALVGTLARLTGIAVPDLAYFAIPPVATALSVLAFWRLLRSWRVPMVALALSTAMVFLLFDAGQHMTLGSFFVSRMWQGKVLLLGIVVPVLFALLHTYGDRPSLRRAGMLFAAGAAGVGLSTTAIFLVPVVAGGCMLAGGLRSRRAAGQAVGGFAAAAAYPVGAGVVTKVGGGRTPDVYTMADVLPANLVHYVLGTGGFALLGLAAALVGPATLRRPSAAAMVSGTVLLVGLLLTPHVPAFVFRHTGLGRVLWRLTWGLPVAALVGALGTGWLGGQGHPLVRAAPAVALCLAMVLFGTPVWNPTRGNGLATHPVLKRAGREVEWTRAILARSRPGDVILAPRRLSQTLLVFSGRVTTVAPRGFFVSALARDPGTHVPQRRRLARFVRFGLPRAHVPVRRRRELRQDLRAVGVDLVCLRRSRISDRRLLGRLGFRPAVRARGLACSRAPG